MFWLCGILFIEYFILVLKPKMLQHFCKLNTSILLVFRLLLWWASRTLKVNGFRLVSVTVHFHTSLKMIMVQRVEDLWRIPTLQDLRQQNSISTPWEVARD